GRTGGARPPAGGKWWGWGPGLWGGLVLPGPARRFSVPSPPIYRTSTAVRSIGMKPSRVGSALPGSIRMYLTKTGPVPDPGTLARLTGTSTCCSTGPGNGACACAPNENAASSNATAATVVAEIFILSSPQMVSPTGNRSVVVAPCDRIRLAVRPLQLDHAHPEHGLSADVDVVLAYEGELAVVADTQDRQTGRDRADRVAVSHVHRKIVLGHEHASAWVDVERARVDGAGLDVLDRARLAGGLIDRVDDDAVLAALEHLLALEFDRVLGAIRPVQKPAVRMHVDRARRLMRAAVRRLGQRFRAEGDLRIDPAGFHLVRVHLVLGLDRDVHPGLRRMKIEMPRPEISASVGGDRHLVGQDTVLVVEDLERAGVFGLGRGALVAARHQDRQPVVGRDAHLMREDAGVDRSRLLHFLAGREVGIDSIHAQRARIVERDQDVLRWDVRGHVDRTGGQPDRLAVLGEHATGGVDAKCGDVMLGPRRSVSGCAAAGCDVQIPPREVRTRALYAIDQAHVSALGH